MKTIKEVITTIIEKMSERNGYKKAWLEKYWGELVGEEARKHSRPCKVERNILFVSVDSSVWNQELFMNRVTLVTAINRKFERNIIESVKYQMGQFLVVSEGVAPQVTEELKEAVASSLTMQALWDKNIMNNLQRKKDKLKSYKIN